MLIKSDLGGNRFGVRERNCKKTVNGGQISENKEQFFVDNLSERDGGMSILSK